MSAPTRTPDLTELRSLVEAADSGTLGRAAMRLHISQPALTKRLQALEQLVGTLLFERSQQGVTLTVAGRRLYEHAQPLLAQAAALDIVVAQLRKTTAPVRLAASHSSAEAFVAGVLGEPAADGRDLAVELVTANSMVVRAMVADHHADVGVCAGRPAGTPNPRLRSTHIGDDEVVCAVPRGHPWAARGEVGKAEFLRTPMVVRDPSSNARWTVDNVLRHDGSALGQILSQAPTPAIARQQALEKNAPVLLSRHVLGSFLVPVTVRGLRFPRRFDLVTAKDVALDAATSALVARLQSAAAAVTATVAG